MNYAFAGVYQEGLTHLDEAIRLSPRDPLLIIWHLCKGWAALLSGRDREAVEFATEATRANAAFPDNYAVLAAAHGQLGNDAEAGAAIKELLRRMPGLTTADHRLNRPFGSAEQRQRFLDGLRLAGLREGPGAHR